MSEETQSNPEDMLRAMAEGRDISADAPDDPAEALETVLNGHADHPAGPEEMIKNGQAKDPLGDIAATSDSQTIQNARQANKARAVQYKQAQASQLAMGFRQVAVPLLFVMALLLLGVGIATMIMTSRYVSDPDNPNVLLENGNLFGGTSIGLGVVLAAGALFFLYELGHMKKKSR